LDSICNPSKYVSRLGLPFSHTQPGLEISKHWIQREQDVTGGLDQNGKPYCFSDGVGKISPALMKKLQVYAEKNSPKCCYVFIGFIKFSYMSMFVLVCFLLCTF